MKRVIYLCIAIVLSFCLAGCTETTPQVQSDENSSNQGEVQSAIVSEAPATQETEAEASAVSVLENTDVSAIVARTDATLENPAAFGEWVATKRHCSVDQQDHTVYFRVTDIIRTSEGNEVQSTIDQYNSENHIWVFEPLESDDIEYCLVKYEVAYPWDFPDDEYGIQTASIQLYAEAPDGGGIDYNGTTYIGLSMITNIGEEPEDFHPGNIYTEGLGLFAMVKGPAEYVIASKYYEGDDPHRDCVRGKY